MTHSSFCNSLPCCSVFPPFTMLQVLQGAISSSRKRSRSMEFGDTGQLDAEWETAVSDGQASKAFLAIRVRPRIH
jgi:hypothetical protein